MASNILKSRLVREAALAVFLLFAGTILLPIAIWFIGQTLFGSYGDGGSYADFFTAMWSRLAAFDTAAWFLALSPLLGISVIRLMILGWRRAGNTSAA